MEDNDNDDNHLDLGYNNPNTEIDSNFEEDNNVLKKRKISESSKDDVQIGHRFTMVEKDFSEEESEQIDESVNISKNNEASNSNNNSKIKESKKKKEKKNKDKLELKLINFKIIFLGDVSVGKTSIIQRYINNFFDVNYTCTIQAEQFTKVIKEDNNTSIKLNIWDTAGQEKFRSLTRQYFRDANGAIIVFDLTKKQTFDYVYTYINEIKNYGENDTIIIIVGNKSDLTSEREIPLNDIKNKLNDEFFYFEVSAKTGNNITMVFDKMKKLIMENYYILQDKRNKEEIRSKSLAELDKEMNENKKCC